MAEGGASRLSAVCVPLPRECAARRCGVQRAMVPAALRASRRWVAAEAAPTGCSARGRGSAPPHADALPEAIDRCSAPRGCRVAPRQSAAGPAGSGSHTSIDRIKPLSHRERGWGEGPGEASRQQVAEVQRNRAPRSCRRESGPSLMAVSGHGTCVHPTPERNASPHTRLIRHRNSFPKHERRRMPSRTRRRRHAASANTSSAATRQPRGERAQHRRQQRSRRKSVQIGIGHARWRQSTMAASAPRGVATAAPLEDCPPRRRHANGRRPTVRYHVDTGTQLAAATLSRRP